MTEELNTWEIAVGLVHFAGLMSVLAGLTGFAVFALAALGRALGF